MTGGQRLWWRSWRWRCWGHGREKPSTPGNAGSSAADGVVRRRRKTWPSAVEVKISGFDVVDGSVRIYGRSMAGGPGRGLSSATTRVAVVGWHGDGWWACCVGDAGRDLRRVGVRGGESVGGRAAECALMLRAASSEWRVGAVLEHGRCRRGWGVRMGRGVVMGCDEPLARGGGAAERVGAVWFGANRVCRRAFRDAQVCCWWAGGRRRCHELVTSGAKHGGTEGDTLRRFLQVGGRGGTGWDG